LLHKLQVFADRMSSVSQIYFEIVNSERRRFDCMPIWKRFVLRRKSSQRIFLEALARMTDLDIVKVTEDALGVRLPHLAQFASNKVGGDVHQQHSSTPHQSNGDDAIEMSNVAASAAIGIGAALHHASEHHAPHELQEVVVDGTVEVTRRQHVQGRHIGQVSSTAVDPSNLNSGSARDFNVADASPAAAPVLRFLGSTKKLFSDKHRGSNNALTSAARLDPAVTPPPPPPHVGAGALVTSVTTIGGSEAVAHPRFKRSTNTSLMATLRLSHHAASASANPADLSPHSQDVRHAPAEALDTHLEVPRSPPHSRSRSRPSRAAAAVDAASAGLELTVPRQPPPRSSSRRAVEQPEGHVHAAAARVQGHTSSQQQPSLPLYTAKLAGASSAMRVAAKQADASVADHRPRFHIEAAGDEDDAWAVC